VLLTTVGYGNTFTPSTPATRQFVMLWALYGLFLFSAGSTAILGAFSILANAARNFVARLVSSSRSTTTAVARVEEPSSNYLLARGLLCNFVAFLVLNGVGAVIFEHTESDMTYFDAFYHCIMTATTIGLGDIAPQSQTGRRCGIAHMILSTILLGSILSTILSGLDRRVQESKKAELLKLQLDGKLLDKLIASLVNQGEGVDRATFVLGMLEETGLISHDDWAPFSEQFKRLDKTGDGLLSHDDLQEMP